MFKKEMNIKFLRASINFIYKNNNSEIKGLLKLCLLKEISLKISEDKLKTLPSFIYDIMKILVDDCNNENKNNVKQNIIDILKNIKGNNIITFSNYIDEIINSNLLNQIFSLLDENNLKQMNDTKNRLSKYNKYINFFYKEFKKSQKKSIFEYAVISLVITERKDLDKFEKERDKCEMREDRILYHGTAVQKVCNILTSFYRQSTIVNLNAINGKGVYFTDSLDYAWYYGGEGGNRANFYKIPKINNTFTVIVNSIYYNRNGLKQVVGNERTPGKNQINVAYADADAYIHYNPDNSKFLATEYVIHDSDQICPFLSMKLKRVEYCIIWRDTNFSYKHIYNSEIDKKFKEFLKERMKYINKTAKYNIYQCETSEEALDLVKRKKYNKIILISNVGTDFGGKVFIDEARKIIGNNVIALFLAYNLSHLDWIKKYKNAIFSNEPKFYEEYLQCFEKNKEIEIKANINNLISKIEKYYNVKFNFDNGYLNYPYFKKEGLFKDLQF